MLVVEDSAQLGRMITAALNQAGHRAVWAATGAEAVETVALNPPEVVLIDLHLDDITGPELAALLHSTLATARLVAVSGEVPTAEVRRLFDAFLLKPVALDTLLATVEG